MFGGLGPGKGDPRRGKPGGNTIVGYTSTKGIGPDGFGNTVKTAGAVSI